MRFYHCGDIGDIIFSLPVVRALGGGTMYLDPAGGQHLEVIQKTTWPGRMKFDLAGANYVAPLLAHQPYIEHVELWHGQEYDICLAEARRIFDNQRNIISHYTECFGVDYSVSDQAWLQAPDEPSFEDVVLVTRTLRYQSNYPEWMTLLHAMENEQVVFLGLPFEYEVFCQTFDVAPPRYQPVENALQAASLIKSCRQYISNQGANHAIAVGLDKQPFAAETQFNENVCRFPNRSIRYF
jgi:hypothetical protein